jgi:hypothetical protein
MARIALVPALVPAVVGAFLLLSAAPQSALASAESMPEFDPRPGCEAGLRSGASERTEVEPCLRSEQDARAKLEEQWAQFAAPDRQRCADRTFMGGPPSYIEVLTCLEIAEAARKLPKDDNTGLDAGLRR